MAIEKGKNKKNLNSINNILLILIIVSIYFMPAAMAANPQIKLTTNRYIILDDPNRNYLSVTANAETGFGLPGSWSTDAWKGESTTVRGVALVLNANGTPASGVTVTFSVLDWDDGAPRNPLKSDTNSKTNVTNAYGLATVPFDLNNEQQYGRWKITATATVAGTPVSSTSNFVYNWWGCQNCHGSPYSGSGSSKSYTSKIFPSSTKYDPYSPYITGRDFHATMYRSDHVAGSQSNELQEGECWACHNSYDKDLNLGQERPDNGASYTGKGVPSTYGVHTNLACAQCHSIIGTSTSGSQTVKSCDATGCHIGATDFNSHIGPETVTAASPNKYVNYSGLDATLGIRSFGSPTYIPTPATFNSNPLTGARAHTSATVQNIPCTVCHGPMHNVTKPNISTVAKNTITEDTQCTTCHQSLKHSSNNPVYCTACHSQDAHNITVLSKTATSQPSYVFLGSTNAITSLTTDCEQCHASGPEATFFGSLTTVDNAAYSTNFAPATPVHNRHNGTVACTVCHDNTNFHDIKFLQPNGAYSTSNMTAVKCVDCHDGTNSAVRSVVQTRFGSLPPTVNANMNHTSDNSGQKWGNYWTTTNDACLYCHGETQHNTSAIGAAGSALGTDRVGDPIGSGTVCSSCHNQDDSNYNVVNSLSPKPPANKPGPNYPSSGAVDHSSYGVTDNDCKSCHDANLVGGENMVGFTHNVAPGGGGGSCMTCHAQATGPGGIYAAINTASFAKHRNVNTTGGQDNLTNDDCKTCHTDISNMYNNGWTTPTKVCSDCHTGSGQYGAKVIDNHRQNGVNITTGASCATCHNNSVNSSFAYSNNATVSHYATKTNLIATQDCTNCHKNSVNGTTWGNALDPAGSPSFPHSISNTPTEECYTCHNSAINFHNKTLVKPLVSTVTCLDCHKTTATMAPKKIDAAVIATGVHKDRACDNCHAGATNTNMDTYSFTTDPARTCTYCHTGAGNFSAPLVAEHNQNGQDVTTAASCTTCHDNNGMYLSNSGTNGTTTAITHYLKDVTNTSTTPYQHLGPVNTSNCIDCHNGPNTSNPDWGSPVNISTSTKREHTETTTAQCNTCHKDGTVSSLANVDFHNASIKLADATDCISCHISATGPGDIYKAINTASFTQHKNVNNTDGGLTNSDCTACHTDITNMMTTGFTTTTKVCSDCHTGTGVPNAVIIDNHRQNGVNISTGASCATCHNNSVNSSFAYSDNATVSHYTTKTNLIATQDCTYCHKNPANASTWGNALDPAGSPSFPHSISNTPTGECYTCHNSAINFHNKTLVKPLVSTVTCLDCHKTTATMAPKEIDATVFGTGVHKNRACKDCHVNATDSNMNTYSFTTDPAKSCTYCHVNSSNLAAPQIAEHSQVGQDATTPDATCNTCHDNSGMYLSNSGTNGTTSAITHYLKDVTNRSTTPYQHFGPINTSNCIDCHNGPNTSNPNWGNPTNISTSTIRPHTETLTSQCDTCHNDGNVSTLANVDFHNKSIKRAPADDCIGCHQNAVGIYAAINTASFTKHENVNTTGGNNVTTNDDCKTCHTDISNMYNNGWTTPTKVCSDCHTGSGQYGAKVIDNHRQNGVNITTGASCATCHNNSVNSSFAYSNNATVSHYATKTNLIATQDCTNCHKNSVNGTTWGNALDPAGSPSFPHSISNTPTEECYTCHNSAINFHNKTLVKPLVSTVTCLDCHKTTATMAPKKIDAAVIATGVHKDRACDNCHAGATNTNMDTYSFTTDPARTCTYCHTGAGNFSAPLVAEHNQNGQDVTTAASCTTCHDNNGMYLSNSGTNGTTTAITHYLKDVTNTSTTPYQHLGPVNTSNCIDCHNGPNTSNPNWGNPVNISTSTMRPHTETLTSECNTCHSDGVVSLADVDFHNASVQLGAGGCIGCHSNVGTVSLGLHSNLNGTSAVEDSDCQTCHFASFSMVTGAANSSNTYYCQDCHTTAGSGPVKPQPVNPTNPLIKDGLAHGKTDCKWCHVAGDQPAYKYHLNGPRGTATGTNCVTCHVSANLPDSPFHAPGESHSSQIDGQGGCADCHGTADNHLVGSANSQSSPAVSGLSVPASVISGTPAEIQATVSDVTYLLQIAAAQYQITNVSGIVIDWTPMTPKDGAFNYASEVVNATLDTTGLKGTYTINVKGMASGPRTDPSKPYYPLNGQWSSVSSTQLIVNELKGYINGTVRNNSVNISGAIVITNTGVTAISDANGFYSLNLVNGTYQLTISKEPEFYTNSSVSVTVTAPATIIRDIILNRKPTGTISGKVAVK